jgi:hypothetical protein
MPRSVLPGGCARSITWGDVATSGDDRLFSKVDHQLTEVQTMADGIATRACGCHRNSARDSDLLLHHQVEPGMICW